MSTQVNPSHNLDALLVGTVEFSFAKGATTIAEAQAAGFLDFGNLNSFTPSQDNTKLEHEGSYRGKRRVDKIRIVKNQLVYKLKGDEWNRQNVKLVFGATDTTAYSQSSKATANADTLAFATTAGKAGYWYDIAFSGVKYRKLTTVTISTLTEGTDFFVDLLNGRVKFAVDQSTNRVPVVTCDAISAGDAESFLGLTPLDEMFQEGYARLVVYDDDPDNNVVIDHRDFFCRIELDSAGELNGTAWTDLTINVMIPDETRSGTLYVRDANENSGV